MSGSDKNTTLGTVRPTKKQRDLLTYIEHFIGEHGYSPSYREIMNGLSYTSVATVALHVNSLISRGHLRKRDRSARSLEVVNAAHSKLTDSTDTLGAANDDQNLAHATWLVAKIDDLFAQTEAAVKTNEPEAPTEATLAGLQTVVAALELLDLPDAADRFRLRLNGLLQPSEPTLTDHSETAQAC